MRAVELAKVAASAEALRLRRIVHRQGMRAAYGAGAAVFALGVLVLLHVVAYHLLIPTVTPTVASLILLVFDIAVAGGLAYMALGNAPDAIEEEAKMIRQQAVVEMRKSMTVMALAGEATNMLFRRKSRRVTVVQPRGTVRLVGDLASRLLARR